MLKEECLVVTLLVNKGPMNAVASIYDWFASLSICLSNKEAQMTMDWESGAPVVRIRSQAPTGRRVT
jgi:hypothetical protein